MTLRFLSISMCLVPQKMAFVFTNYLQQYKNVVDYPEILLNRFYYDKKLFPPFFLSVILKKNCFFKCYSKV